MPKKKTTKQSQSRFKRFVSKIIPRTPKSQLLAFIVIFALIGGGVYLYRSFAATSTYHVENGNLVRQEGSYKTFWVNPKTGARQRITWLDNVQFPDAKVSPNGQYISVIEQEGSGSTRKELLTVRKIDGSGRKVLDSWFSSMGTNVNATWSPDSTKLAYLKVPDQANPIQNVYSVGVDGKKKTQVTKNTKKYGFDKGSTEYPSLQYAADGRMLATYYSEDGTEHDIMINSKGDQTELPNVNGGGSPAPYSSRIAWSWYDYPAGKWYLTITNLEGFNDPNKVTFETARAGGKPLWAPDEKSVLVSVDGLGIQQFDVANGTVLRTLPRWNDGYFPSSWQPIIVPNLFNPTAALTRVAMADYMYRAGGLPEVPTADEKCGAGKPGPFKDVPGTHTFCKEIEWMNATGLSTGYADSTFKPNDKVTRQAMAAFLYRLAGSPEVPTAAAKCGAGKPGPFKDVPGTHTFCKEIEWMNATGLSTGYADSTFKPTESTSQQAAATFLHRVKGSPDPASLEPVYADVPANHQFFKAIQWLNEQR